MREQFAQLYREPLPGKIYLPHFCVKTEGEYEPLDYFRHLLGEVNVSKFAYDEINWLMSDALREAKDRFYRIGLGAELTRTHETEVDHIEGDAATQSWLLASLSFDFLSHKQLRFVVGRVYQRLIASELQLKDRLALVKFVVRDHIQRFIEQNVDKQTEAAFKSLFKRGKLQFYLECARCRYEVPKEMTVRTGRQLPHDEGDLTSKSLFDFVSEDQTNDYERSVALFLDRDENVLWWYRNLVGEGSFAIQGYRRRRVHPDFVAQR